jgi:hypothetical protein
MVVHDAVCCLLGDPATFTVSQHKQTAPSTFGRAVGILIGLLLLLFVYYYIRDDTFPKDFYTGRGVGRVAGFGLVLTVGVLWAWFRDWRRNRPK